MTVDSPAFAGVVSAGERPALITEVHRQEVLPKAGALRNAILRSADFSSHAPDDKALEARHFRRITHLIDIDDFPDALHHPPESSRDQSVAGGGVIALEE
jgi:hypothetical protein